MQSVILSTQQYTFINKVHASVCSAFGFLATSKNLRQFGTITPHDTGWTAKTHE